MRLATRLISPRRRITNAGTTSRLLALALALALVLLRALMWRSMLSKKVLRKPRKLSSQV